MGCFGWKAFCVNNNDWETYTDLEDKLLTEAIPKDLKERVLEISEQKRVFNENGERIVDKPHRDSIS